MTLVAIPVYNEAQTVAGVLSEVRRYADDLLIVDDGSTDGTAAILATIPNLTVITHGVNRGYGAALQSAFAFAIERGYDFLITMDCDGQHQPDRIPVLMEQIDGADIVSGSRYYREFRNNNPAPGDRRAINGIITQELNHRYGFELTDAFCGFKAYRVDALKRLKITERGWGMPLELWVQAARLGLRIREIAVPRLYLDPKRAFGGVLDDPDTRLQHYREVIERADALLPCALACP